MPHVFDFYVIDPAKLPAGDVRAAVLASGSRWATVEARASELGDALDRIQATLPLDAPALARCFPDPARGAGLFSAQEAGALDTALRALPAEIVDALTSIDRTHELTFHALADTAHRAAVRGFALAVLQTG